MTIQSMIFFPLAACTVVYLTLMLLMNRRLRTDFPAAWDEQGRPTLFNMSPANGIKFCRFFIFSSRYKSLSDSRLDNYAAIARVLFALCMVLFLGGVASVFVR